MKLHFVWFTCSRDSELLELSMRRVGELFPGARRTPLFDHADWEALATGHRVTAFERRGNLNGIECINGMLHAMKDVSEPDETVFKIDSDVLVGDPAIVARAEGRDFYGQYNCICDDAGRLLYTFSTGGFYAVSGRLLHRWLPGVPSDLLCHEEEEHTKRYAEDECVSLICRRLCNSNGGNMALDRKREPWLHRWTYSERNPGRFGACEFRDVQRMPKLPRVQLDGVALSMMRSVAAA